MDDFINDLLTPETKEQAIAAARTLSIREFWDFMCRLRRECKLNAYATQRPPLRIDDDECLRIISRSLHRHFLSQNVTACTASQEYDTTSTCQLNPS